MTDYGHPLSFGSFLTPSNAAPAETVALAVLSEQVGLDLVTFQDHPYQPGFLDTWTLLSFVAARTSRVHLAANVANLPLRPPAVLARSVASLDLLSGGRVELGLGAGAFWDAIEAMGGRRLAPGQAVQALEEAIGVIRQLWDVDTPGGVRVEGAYHGVVGAKRGPAPAHPVEIWLGAYKPKMLAVTGRLADGWLPSLGLLQPGDLRAGNAAIDEAAAEAGRRPEGVRRLLNITGQFTATGRGRLQGPAEQWAQELADLALGDGISAFILGSDDPADLRVFAGDVVPAVRELVDAERGAGGASTTNATSTTSTTGTTGTTSTTGTTGTTSTTSVPAAPAATRRASPAPRRPAAISGALDVHPTPDDGSRRSSTAAWDETSRPSGPVPDPRRSYTPHERASAHELIQVHDHLRAELAQIDALIEQVAAGTRGVGSARSHISTMTLRQNNWTLGTYCESYCRVVTMHHTLEDQAMFPHLVRGDPRLAPVIERLESEHLTIHGVLEAVDQALVALVSDPGGLTALRTAVDRLSDTLLSHLAYEERELVEPLARLGLRTY